MNNSYAKGYGLGMAFAVDESMSVKSSYAASIKHGNAALRAERAGNHEEAAKYRAEEKRHMDFLKKVRDSDKKGGSGTWREGNTIRRDR